MKNNLSIFVTFTIIISLIVVLVFWAKPNIFKSIFATNQNIPVNASNMQDVYLKNGDNFNLTAEKVVKNISGVSQTMLAYNGSIPGPTIHVNQGSEITINFKNNTDEKQLLHSHGVRMDNKYDGSQLVQKELLPGESFSYKLKFPDAGVYWYHPHANEVRDQMLGLYGAFIVEPKQEDYYPKVNQKKVLFVSDILMNNNKININPNDHALMGHYGNVMLTNGEENYNLDLKQGEVTRLYIINSANARPFKIKMDGIKMKLIGDDNGAYEIPKFVSELIISPSERRIVDIYAGKIGNYKLQNVTPKNTYDLAQINIIEADTKQNINTLHSFFEIENNLAAIKDIDIYRKYFNNKVDKRLQIKLDMNMGTVNKDGIEWEDARMNMMDSVDKTKWKIIDMDTDKDNMNINWNLEKDKPIIIEINNPSTGMHTMQHPIHFHGERFLVLARNDIKENDMAWKDTVLVPSGQKVKILLDTSNPGDWMAHCHIAEHLATGMMFGFTIK